MKQTWAWFRSVTQYDPIISPYDLLLLMIASGYVHDHMIINDSMIKIQELFTCFLVFILFENGYEFWQSPSPFGCNLLPRSDRHGRFLLAREALLSQGFPVEQSLSHDRPCCSFALGSESSRTAQIGQAGNAMNCMVCAMVLLFAMTQTRKSEIGIMSGSFESMLSKFSIGLM